VRNAVIGGSIGTLLEYYDFAIYAFLAPVIGRLFFPPPDKVGSLLAAFAVFGIGFFARPFGGIALGWFGDRYGRKPVLLLTFFLMAVSTATIGILPTYESIGIAAPVLLVAARLVQGFSTGGEWGGAAVLVTEWAPMQKRGLLGSLQVVGSYSGLLCGSAIAALLYSVLGTGGVENWGWRLAFLLGAVIGPFGLYQRSRVDETPAFLSREQAIADPAQVDSPIVDIIKALGFAAILHSGAYVYLSFLPSFTQTYTKISSAHALWASSLALVATVIVLPIAGHLSDLWGRRPVLLVGSVGLLVVSYPAINALLVFQSFTSVCVVSVILGALIGIYAGPTPATMAEMFPTRRRYFGISLGYNIAAVLFGGFAPYISAWLVAQTEDPISITYFVMFTTVLSSVVVACLSETAGSKLR